MRYPIVIEPGDDKNAYGVVVPDLPGCFSAGDTLDEAFANAREAITGWIEMELDNNQDIPSPSSLEKIAATPEYKGWILGTVEMPAKLQENKPELINVQEFAFPVKVERDGEFLVLSFRDIPQALGQMAASDEKELDKEALETLTIALKEYFKLGELIPKGSAPRNDEKLIRLPLSFVSKILLHNTMIQNKVRPATLAHRLGIPTSEVARITNPSFKTKIDTMAAAVSASGGRLTLVLL